MLYSFFNLGDRRGGWSVTTRPLYPRERNPVRIIQEAGLTPGPVWMSEENLAPVEIRFPSVAARSESLYRLSCCC
jgi:hypothetical protein